MKFSFVANLTMMQCVTMKTHNHTYCEAYRQAFNNILTLKPGGFSLLVGSQIYDKVITNFSDPRSKERLNGAIVQDQTTRGTSGYCPENTHEEIAKRMSLEGYVIVLQDTTKPADERILYMTPDEFNKKFALFSKLRKNNPDTDAELILEFIFFKED